MLAIQRCFECNGVFANCARRPGTTDGPGVPNTDLIIYVSGDCTGSAPGVLAFASSCELEDELDRLVYVHSIDGLVSSGLSCCWPSPFPFRGLRWRLQ